MQATTVREALRASLAGTFGTALSVVPRLVVFAIALAVGWVVASLLARGTIATLQAVRFDDMARRSGLARFIQHMGVQQGPTDAVANVAKWLVRLMTLVLALDVLGLPAGSGVLHQLLLWLPNLAVGLVALVIGGVAAAALSRLVRGAATVAGLPNPQVLATATSVAVWAFAIVLAVSQLGIATSVVDLGLVGVVGGIALAAGLAFGWAGRERAAQLLALLEGRYASLSPASGAASDVAGAQAPAAESPVAESPVAESVASESPAEPPASESPAAESAAAAAGLPSAVLSSGTPALDRSVPAGERAGAEFDRFAPALDVPVAETEPSRGLDDPDAELGPSAAELDPIAAEFEPSDAKADPVPDFESSPPTFQPSTLDFNEVGAEFNGAGAELNEAGAEFNASSTELEGPSGELDARGAEFDSSPQSLDAHASGLDTPHQDFHAFAPAREPSPPLVGAFAHQPGLFPDTVDPEPAPAVAFEESWIPRSGFDRRRIPRSGPDRRASGA